MHDGRTFGLVLAYTGCRISEVLELTPRRIDLAAQAITLRTLKQRRQNVYRAVPVPGGLLDDLELVGDVINVGFQALLCDYPTIWINRSVRLSDPLLKRMIK